ncbi:ribosomal protein acetylating enzyme [Companilactobacillus sp. RD055328]|uniref:GNAT family N-acetyltransferase n=1 Tax=Companilactobacillus sp. RD055328 TaxID=2916634 RepID=UPI001FC82834|nr:GNAT family N-acetyltransferase [Companilactobacillus sp. RD055328]GKQ43222.1 ribosomal protein acetylating enzyme [Companilactobacillus sp. RD055328]
MKTKKIRLEETTLNDTQEIFELINRNRDRFNQWFNWVEKVTTVEDEKEFIEISIFDETQELYSIKFENHIIGIVDLQRVDLNNASAEVGYWIDEVFEGQGIVSNLVANLDEKTTVDKLKIIVNRNNTRAINVAQRAGFEFAHLIKGNIIYQKAF